MRERVPPQSDVRLRFEIEGGTFLAAVATLSLWGYFVGTRVDRLLDILEALK